MISVMRVLSSPQAVAAGESVARTIVETYLAPNKTMSDLRKMVSGDVSATRLAMSSRS
jgi:hypothetical protein